MTPATPREKTRWRCPSTAAQRALLALVFLIAAVDCGASGGNIGQPPREAGAEGAEESGREGGVARDAGAEAEASDSGTSDGSGG
jgi:hypothetical protein